MKKNLSILFSIIILSAVIGFGARLVFAQLGWEEPTDTPPIDNEIPLWIKNGNDLHHTTGGNVGIGSTSPQEKMDIGGILRAVSGHPFPGKGPGYGAIQGWSNLVGAGGFGYGNGSFGVYGNATTYGIVGVGTTGVYGYTASPIGFGGYFTNNPSTGQGNGLYASSICLGTTTDCKTAWSQVSGASDWSAITNKPAGFADDVDDVGGGGGLTGSGTGNYLATWTGPSSLGNATRVGIGNLGSFYAALTVSGAVRATGSYETPSGFADGAYLDWWSSKREARLTSGNSGTGGAGISSDLSLNVEYNGSIYNALYIKGDTRNVGIGTASPGAKLEVAGQVKITGGSPGAGKVLTSDASGLATWQTPAIGGITSVNALTGPAITINGGGSATVTSSGNTITISTPTCSPATAAITCSSNNTQSCSASCPSGYIITSWTCDAGNKTISGNTGSCWWNTNVYRSGSGSCTKSC